MKYILFCLWLTLASVAGAQKPPIKFGDVSDEDLTMSVYSKDSSAAAVILADYGESQIIYNQSKGFELIFERIRRIKILKSDGYDWANITIPVYGRGGKDEDVGSIKASTFNIEGGKKTESKISKSSIFRENVNENWWNVKLTLPNVKEGSVIDIAYQITSPYFFNFQDWEFQTTVPTVWSEYIARIPEYFEYQKFSQGYITFAVNEEKVENKNIVLNYKERNQVGGMGGVTKTSYSQERIDYREKNYRWVAKDVPAFKEEPYMTNYRDYMSKINFELAYIKLPNRPMEMVMGSWENINKEYLESSDFGGAIKRTGNLRSIVEEQIAGKTNPDEKIATVFTFVRNSMEWNGDYRKFSDGNFKKLLESKKGNSADINLMLIALLREAGIAADPVLISTRNHGFVREYIPISTQFNYVIAAVTLPDNNVVLLDATERSLPISMLPERCLNGKGLIIADGGHKWVDVSTKEKSRKVVGFELAFNEQGDLNGTVSTSYVGFDAQHTRSDYHKKGEEEYLKNLSQLSGWTLKKSEFENVKDLNQAMKETHEVLISEHVQMAGNTIIFNPFIQSDFAENPFKLEKRNFPVDFGYPFEQTYSGKFLIPDGFIIDETPDPKVIALPGNAARFIYSLTPSGNAINFTSLLSVNRPLFSQDEYPNVREFFAQVVAKQAEMIVLKKQ